MSTTTQIARSLLSDRENGVSARRVHTPAGAPDGAHTTSDPAGGLSSAQGHASRGAHNDTALRQNSSADGGANAVTAPSSTSPRRRRVAPTPIDPDTAAALVLYYADIVGDLEQARIAAAGRLRALVAPPPWGKGINSALPEVVVAEAGLAETKALEATMTARLRKAMAAHPLGPWVNATVGLGEKSMARWLAAVGDLAARETPAQVWAYCGLYVLHPDQGGQRTSDAHSGIALLGNVEGEGQNRSDLHAAHALAYEAGNAGDHCYVDVHTSGVPGIAPRRTRGVKANWSTDAKTRLYVVAEGCVKARTSPYRPVYDAARERYADAVHAYPCAQCKAAAGEPLKDGHKHARAMRALMKRIALEAWREARIAAGLPHNKNRKARVP